jgi:hypothetical protein
MYRMCKLLYEHILRVFYIELILLLVCTSILRTIHLLVFTIGLLSTLLFSVRIDGNKWSSVSSNRSNTVVVIVVVVIGVALVRSMVVVIVVGPVDVILVLLKVLFAVVVVVEEGWVVAFSSISHLFVGF